MLTRAIPSNVTVISGPADKIKRNMLDKNRHLNATEVGIVIVMAADPNRKAHTTPERCPPVSKIGLLVT